MEHESDIAADFDDERLSAESIEAGEDDTLPLSHVLEVADELAEHDEEGFYT